MIANSLISLAISPILLAEGLITRFRVPRWKEPAGDKAKSRFDVVVTTLGVNDVVSHVRPARWLAQQAELRRMLEERFGARLLVISGLAPMHGFPALPQPLRWHLGWYATALDGYLKADLAGEKKRILPLAALFRQPHGHVG